VTDHATQLLARTLNPTLYRRLPRAGNAKGTSDPTMPKHAAQAAFAPPTTKGDS